MPRDKSTKGGYSRVSRRPFLKTAGTGLVAGLAGCTGNEGQDTTTEGSDGGGTTVGQANDGSSDIEGTSLTVWDPDIWSQNALAEEASKQFEQRASDELGLELDWQRGSPDDLFGGKYRTRIQQGTEPDVFWGLFQPFSAQFSVLGATEPLDSWRQWISDEHLNNIEWLMDKGRQAYKNWPGQAIHGLPGLFIVQDPWLARMDHFEAAGLDPSNDWPPQDYEHAIEIATTIKENGVSNTPFPIYTMNDTFDEMLPQWALAEGGEDGLILNDDWSDIIIDNDTWKKVFRQYVDVQNKHDVSWGNAVGSGDEDVIPLIMSGQASMIQPNFLTYPTLLDRVPDQMEDGTIQYGAPWQEPSGVSGAFLPYNHVLNYRDGEDSAKAKRKLKAGAKLIDLFLSEQTQATIPQDYGQFPVNQAVWDRIRNEMDENYGHKAYQSQLAIAEDAIPWAVHPQAPTYQYDLPVTAAEKAVAGDLDPDEALEQGAQEVRNQVDFEIDFSNVRKPGDSI